MASQHKHTVKGALAMPSFPGPHSAPWLSRGEGGGGLTWPCWTLWPPLLLWVLTLALSTPAL